jgi:hypothetical protein
MRAVDKLQGELDESARRNAELQKQVESLRAELKAIRPDKPLAAGEEKARPGDPRAAEGAEGRKVEPHARAAPTYANLEQNGLLVISPEGDKVTVYYPATKEATSLRLSEDRKTPREVSPITGPGIVGLRVLGPKITRLGVFLPEDGKWYPLNLREPVDEASPNVSPGSVVYVLGRRIYAFNTAANAKRWDVLEFPEGTEPTPFDVGVRSGGSAKYDKNSHIYTFNNQSGKWEDVDVRAAP